MLYYPDRCQIEISGCNNCPFLHYMNRELEIDPYCCIYAEIDSEACFIDSTYIPDKFPENCPIKSPNFKVIRKLK